MVEYDSIIPPGRAGKVTEEVNLHGIRGSFRKDIVVVSNAANEPALRLYLKGTVNAIIDFSPSYIELSARPIPAAGTAITLKTDKQDLAISSVVFESSDNQSSQWHENLPVHIKYALARDAEKDADGVYGYTLTLHLDVPVQNSKYGAFKLSTNHRLKPVLEIRGVIRGGK